MGTGKTEIKKWIKEEFASLTKQHKFKIGTFYGTGTYAFHQTDDRGYRCIWFDIDSITVGFYFSIRINEVEELMFLKSDYRLFLVNETLQLPDLLDKFEYTSTTTREELMAYLQPLKDNFASIVSQLEYYSVPQHVLDLWLGLKTEKDINTYFFNSFNYCKILIVAQLCKSPMYDYLVKQSLSFYKSKVAADKNWNEELSVCEKIISHYQNKES
jgi:hypothetical protein